MDENTIVQDALNRIGQTEPPAGDPPAPDTAVVPDQNQNGDNPPPELSDEQKKANAAFAAMRTENAALKAKLAEMEAKFNQNQQQTPPPDTPPQETAPAVAPEVAERIKQMEERLAQYETQRTEAEERTARDRAVQGLVTVRNEFNLDEAGLQKFVQDAERAGYDIVHTTQPLRQIYTGLYFDTLVKSEVERIQNEYKQQQAPRVGPIGAVPGTRQGNETSRARLAAVAEKYLPKE